MVTKRRVSVRTLRLVIGLVAILAVLGGGWLWVRDSSLVAVNRVTVSGVYGPDAGQIRTVLSTAARNMTTLDVRLGQLRNAVAPYPVVKKLHVSTQFPHGMRIRVVELLPVGALTADGRSIAASPDGTLLPDVSTSSLPTISLESLPGGSHVTDPSALGALTLLADAPPRLESRISQVTTTSDHGLVAQLSNGPSLYFGDSSDLDAKWIAATEVLADSGSAGATYVDVSDPSRPAAGVSDQAVVAAGLSPNQQGSASATGSDTPSAVAGDASPSSSSASTGEQ
jgi:cell division protein FtsQ